MSVSKNYYSNLTWLILNVDVGSVVKSENGASHNRHNAVNRTLFPLHYSQNWDNTTFFIMSFRNLKPRRIIAKGLYFFHHFLCSHRNFWCHCHLYFFEVHWAPCNFMYIMSRWYLGISNCGKVTTLCPFCQLSHTAMIRLRSANKSWRD